MYKFSDLSESDIHIIAKYLGCEPKNSYEFKKLNYPDVHILNRSTAWGLASLKDENSEVLQRLKGSIEDYNSFIVFLEGLEGFVQYFVENEFCLSMEQIENRYGEKNKQLLLNFKQNYIFETDIVISSGYIFDKSIVKKYEVDIDEGSFEISIGTKSDGYPDKVGNKEVIWNWIDNGHDFCFYLWQLLGERCVRDEDKEPQDDDVTYFFDSYEQFREDVPEPQLVRIFEKLEKLGYIKVYTLEPKVPDPLWNYRGKQNGHIDFATVDKSFLTNKLLMEQIELILWTPADVLSEHKYFVTDVLGKQILSKNVGNLGGHNKLKIYGRLDCPSAKHYLEKGGYVRHRVFFVDEETAKKAGYRPCAKCMPEAYKEWKNK